MANQMLTFYDNYDSKGEDSEDDWFIRVYMIKKDIYLN
jgi:hypothetical protein